MIGWLVVVLVARGAFAMVAGLRGRRHEPRLVKLLPPAPGGAIAAPQPWPRSPRPLPGACPWCGWVERIECAAEVAMTGRCTNQHRSIRRNPIVDMPVAGPGRSSPR